MLNSLSHHSAAGTGEISHIGANLTPVAHEITQGFLSFLSFLIFFVLFVIFMLFVMYVLYVNLYGSDRILESERETQQQKEWVGSRRSNST